MCSFIAFWHTWVNTDRKEVEGGPSTSQVTTDGPFHKQIGNFPCCCPEATEGPLTHGRGEFPWCWSVSSDRDGSEKSLWFNSALMWMEPFLDITSILNLLRVGQPFPSLFIALGIAIPCIIARDPLQLSGARAAAASLRSGFETPELMEHKAKELWEAMLCTAVQVYSLNAMHPAAMNLSTVLQLLFSVILSLVVSIPSGVQAKVVIRKPPLSWTYANLQAAKRSVRWWEKVLLVSGCACYGWCGAWGQRDVQAKKPLKKELSLIQLLGPDLLQMLQESWPSWQCPGWQWLCALLLLSFRFVCAVALAVFVILFFVHECSRLSRSEDPASEFSSEDAKSLISEGLEGVQ
eukprot:Skav223269  [mRNA]  locus=scaffold3424:60320:61366:+ [translate_table: standard]